MKYVLLRLRLRPDLLLVAGRHCLEYMCGGGCEYCWAPRMAGQRYIGRRARFTPSNEASMMMFSVVGFVGDVTRGKSMPEARRASHTLYRRSRIEDRG